MAAFLNTQFASASRASYLVCVLAKSLTLTWEWVLSAAAWATERTFDHIHSRVHLESTRIEELCPFFMLPKYLALYIGKEYTRNIYHLLVRRTTILLTALPEVQTAHFFTQASVAIRGQQLILLCTPSAVRQGLP